MLEGERNAKETIDGLEEKSWLPDYATVAQAHEEVFRAVLRDLKMNRDKRPMGYYVPEDLETETTLDKIIRKYSTGDRYGIFTIVNFAVDNGNAIIDFQDIACMSGGGATLVYKIAGVEVKYLHPSSITMS